MPEELSFPDLIKRVRAGDGAACTELVRRYEPAIRVAVHVRLTDPALRRVLDTLDVCNSVLANFFARAALGQFELETPAQLVGLLRKMATRRLLDHVDKQHAQVRDIRLDVVGVEQDQFADPHATPSQVVANRELLDEVRSRLSPDERYLADQRGLGRSWEELARELGESPGALRLRLRRALDRILPRLGLEP